jgi:thioredoxin reductase
MRPAVIHETPDVLVIGLGPAGSRAAETAAKAGLRGSPPYWRREPHGKIEERTS